ncbi:50S ribosomal protein L5 [bacterium]|nr:50S ribosomal protein L5 [bacterium]|tara:strand:+ start:11231 stop:11764 length:534 start_codon:yes stop_codon:yes gene_type:complete
MQTVKEKAQNSFSKIKEALGVTNVMSSPRLVKVVLSSGTGKITDKRKKELVTDRLTKIAGQKPAPRGARKSIATFKLREGDVIGTMVTLRGDRMYSFLDKFINIALPRMRDFKGIDPKAIDSMGNLTIGLPEHTIFPETGDEDLRDVFGLSVTVVTTAPNKEMAEAFLREIGIPFKK